MIKIKEVRRSTRRKYKITIIEDSNLNLLNLFAKVETKS